MKGSCRCDMMLSVSASIESNCKFLWTNAALCTCDMYVVMHPVLLCSLIWSVSIFREISLRSRENSLALESRCEGWRFPPPKKRYNVVIL